MVAPSAFEPAADVFFLPLAVCEEFEVWSAPAALIARRLPDFLHQLINQGSAGPTCVVEVQTVVSDGDGERLEWAQLREAPTPQAAFELLPDGEHARAVVCGTLERGSGELRLCLQVVFAEDLDSPCAVSVSGALDVHDPVAGLLRVGDRLARVLQIDAPAAPPGLLTHRGDAFFRYLVGLDGIAVLTGDVGGNLPSDPAALVQPVIEALDLDPTFGLALRTVQVALIEAHRRERIDAEFCHRQFDLCLRARPVDGEGCVDVAETSSALGDGTRARAWLEHAAALREPPARGLESLGILHARDGDMAAARGLWTRGLELDGHPDFFAHLARLAFVEGDDGVGWERIVRGLHRLYERAVRPLEFDADCGGAGVLLAYLVDHLRVAEPPPQVVTAMVELVGNLTDAGDRVHLGCCLLEVGEGQLAAAELDAGLLGELDPELRDVGVRARLRLRVVDFEVRFQQAVDEVLHRRDPSAAIATLIRFRETEPDFWPALFWIGVGTRRTGDEDAALDLMAEVLRRRPGQSNALLEMAELFDARGNPKRALECIDDALGTRPADPTLLARRALYQHHLGRLGQARTTLESALRAWPEHRELRRLRRRIG